MIAPFWEYHILMKIFSNSRKTKSIKQAKTCRRISGTGAVIKNLPNNIEKFRSNLERCRA